MNQNDFLFSIVDTADGSAIFITAKDTWDNEGIMSESFKDEELEVLDPILEKAGLLELMGSSFEMTKPEEETKEILLEQGLMQDKNFDKFINREYH